MDIKKNSIVGKSVSVEVSPGVFIDAIVKGIDEKTGRVNVVDEYGNVWKGFEYRMQIIDDRWRDCKFNCVSA